MSKLLLAFLLMLAAVPAAAALPLSAYGALPGIEMAAISPSGQRYAVVGVVGEARRLVVVGATGKVEFTVELGDTKLRDIAFAGEDLLVMTRTDYTLLGPDYTASHAELTQVTIVSMTDRKLHDVFSRGRVANAVFGSYGIVETDGRWYGHYGGLSLSRGTDPTNLYYNQRSADLYRVDLADGDLSRVAEGDSGGSREWALDGAGAVLAQLEFRPNGGDWTLRSGTSGKVLFSGKDPSGEVRLIGAGRTPGTIVYAEPDAAGGERWFEVALASGARQEILSDETAISGILQDRRTRVMAGFVRDGDRPTEIYYDPARSRRVAAARKAFGGRTMRVVDASDSFDRLIVRTDGNDDAGTWWLVDIPTGKATDIGLAYPAVRAADVNPVSTVTYKAGDGLEITGVLTLPRGAEPRRLPIVVLPHGGPFARDYPQFDWWAQAFAARGYAVFQPNFRGSSGYGAAFRKAGRQQWGKAMQTDISDGVAHLASRGTIDPARACIVGASYGGYAALAGVTLQQGLYRCAVSVNGVTDLVALFSSERRESAADRTWLRTWKQDIGAAGDLAAISPARHADRADAPVLLIHGRQDTVVPPAQSRTMAERLRAAGKPVELVTLDGEDHWLSKGQTRQAMLEAAVAFVERHNPPATLTPAPAP